MSDTNRIYNRKNLKKTPRYNLDDPRFTGNLKDVVRKGLVIPHHVGMPLTHRSWICMGKCPQCRDSDLDPRHQRKIRQREFARTLSMEMEDVCRHIASHGDYMRTLQPTEFQQKISQETIEYLKGENK